MKFKLILLVLALFSSLQSYSQKHAIVKGRVVDTAGNVIAGAKIALISKNGNDKSIKITNESGQFYFLVKKNKLKNYSLRCYYVGNTDKDILVPLKDFMISAEYVVKTNDKNSSRNKNHYYYIYNEQIYKNVYWDSPGYLNEYIRSHFGMVK